MVWQDGELVVKSYFGEQKPGGTINSRSLAKPLGVIAVGRAIEMGHIKSLDQPASDYFHEWKNDGRSEILIRHLLDMRSGLMAQSQETDPNHVMNRAYLHPAHDKVILDEYPLINPPGTRYDYSNANAELVAPLIERATGIQYEDWISKEVLTLLGAKGGEVWMNREGGTAGAASCCRQKHFSGWLSYICKMVNGMGNAYCRKVLSMKSKWERLNIPMLGWVLTWPGIT